MLTCSYRFLHLLKTEATVQRCSIKNLVWKVHWKTPTHHYKVVLQENLEVAVRTDCRRIVWACLPMACNFIKKETPAQVCSYEFCKIIKNTFFIEHLRCQLRKIRKFLVIFSEESAWWLMIQRQEIFWNFDNDHWFWRFTFDWI